MMNYIGSPVPRAPEGQGPNLRQPMLNTDESSDRYGALARQFMQRDLSQSTSTMARPDSFRDLASFARTPKGRMAIQGAVDMVMQQSRRGAPVQISPYEQIINSLRQAMQMRPPTA